MDALILTCGTGGGHNAAALAMKEELIRRGHHAVVLNPYNLVSNGLAAKINTCYISIARNLPKLFGFIYSLGNLYRKLPFRSPVYFINGKINPILGAYLEEHHFDVIITTHLFPAEILTNMRNHGISIPKSVFIATDYACIPFTEETDCDYCIIPSADLIGEFSSYGIKPERIHPLGIPTKEAFHLQKDTGLLKKKLGLDPATKYILISGGSMGAGKLRYAIQTIFSHYENNSGVKLIVICGNNTALYKRLSRQYSDKMILIKHTDQMAQYMAVCEAVITKPGGLSSTEAAVSNSRLIHISPIPGCESKNARFFSKNGCSIYEIGRAHV